MSQVACALLMNAGGGFVPECWLVLAQEEPGLRPNKKKEKTKYGGGAKSHIRSSLNVTSEWKGTKANFFTTA